LLASGDKDSLIGDGRVIDAPRFSFVDLVDIIMCQNIQFISRLVKIDDNGCFIIFTRITKDDLASKT
jgi:hypothetical protein